MAEPGHIIKHQSTEAFGRLSHPGFARAVRTWTHGALFLYDLVSGSLFLGVWVLHVDTGLSIFRETNLSVGASLVRRWLHVLHQYLAFG